MAAVNNSYILARNSRLPIPSDTDGARKRVVIVGGGFTVRLNIIHMVPNKCCKFSNAVVYSQGCTVASILDPMTRFEVVLIDNKGKIFFSFSFSFSFVPFSVRHTLFYHLPFLHGGLI
jgi:hypothetical protein